MTAHPTSTATAVPGGPDQPRQRLAITFGVLALGAFAYTMLQSMVLPALPAIQRDLHTSQSTVTWVLTAYLLAPPWRRRSSAGSVTCSARSGCSCVVLAALDGRLGARRAATSMMILIVARVIQGLAGAVFPLAFGIIRDEFPAPRVRRRDRPDRRAARRRQRPRHRARRPDRRHLSLPLAVLDPADGARARRGDLRRACSSRSRRSARPAGSTGWPARCCRAGWWPCCSASARAATGAGRHRARLGLFAAAVVLFALWAWVEAHSAHPLVDMRMMRIPAVMWTNNSSRCCSASGCTRRTSLLPPFLQTPEVQPATVSALASRSPASTCCRALSRCC